MTMQLDFEESTTSAIDYAAKYGVQKPATNYPPPGTITADIVGNMMLQGLARAEEQRLERRATQAGASDGYDKILQHRNWETWVLASNLLGLDPGPYVEK